MKTLSATDYLIEDARLQGATDERVRPFVELALLLEHEAIPEDPPRPFDAVASRMRSTSSLFETRRLGAWTADGELAANVYIGRSTQDNLHIRDVWIGVRPEHRRRGLAKRLLGSALDTIESDPGLKPDAGQEIVVQSFTHSRVSAGVAFAERAGLKPGLRARASQLDLGALDRAQMKEWASIDPAGYRLEWIDGETPDRLLDNVVEAIRVMNTMPREDLQWEDWKITRETVREWERLSKERGQNVLRVLAIDEGTGKTAGFTEIFYDPRVPSVLHQGGTAVEPSHRGKGIGKWVKAQMALRILREMPNARYVRTENAGTNAAMLAINVAMGFTAAWEEVIWQAPIAEVRRYAEAAR